MFASRFSLGQVLGIGVGVITAVGVVSLAGGAIGYQLGKHDGQVQAQTQPAVTVDDGANGLPFLTPSGSVTGNFSLPKPMPLEGETPPEFGTPKAYLGVLFESGDDGALVREAIETGPAAQAGLQAGDVITAVAGEPVDADHTLSARIAAHNPNDEIELTVVRDGETLTLHVTLGERQGADPREFQFRALPDGQAPSHFGDPSDCLPSGGQG